MGIVFGKESKDFYSAFFIPDPAKRKDALDQWVKATTPVIQAAVGEELQSIVELVTKDKYNGEVPTPIIPKSEIDLHEKYVREAIPIVEEYLQESYDACLDQVRIIHGKGIGVLRQAIRDYFQNHKLVKSFKSADKDHGGDGATEVYLKDVVTD